MWNVDGQSHPELPILAGLPLIAMHFIYTDHILNVRWWFYSGLVSALSIRPFSKRACLTKLPRRYSYTASEELESSWKNDCALTLAASAARKFLWWPI